MMIQYYPDGERMFFQCPCQCSAGFLNDWNEMYEMWKADKQYEMILWQFTVANLKHGWIITAATILFTVCSIVQPFTAKGVTYSPCLYFIFPFFLLVPLIRELSKGVSQDLSWPFQPRTKETTGTGSTLKGFTFTLIFSRWAPSPVVNGVLGPL